MKDTTLTIRISSTVLNRFKSNAEISNRKYQDVVRELIESVNNGKTKIHKNKVIK